MSSSSPKGDLPSFPKLTNDNYTAWAPHAQGHLKLWSCWGVVEWEPEPPKFSIPTTTTTTTSPISPTPQTLSKEWTEWKCHDEKAEGLILSLVEADQDPYAAGSSSAKDLWDKLKAANKVEHNGMTAFFTKVNMFKCEYKTGDSMQSHIATYSNDNHLHQIGSRHAFSDKFFSQLLLMSLPWPSNWEIIVISLITTSSDASPLTFCNVSACLLQEASHLSGSEAASEDYTLLAKKPQGTHD
jgi:gag-polypeptide of LTR copia-type